MKLTKDHLAIIPAISQTMDNSVGLYEHSLLFRATEEIRVVLDLLTPAQWTLLKSNLKDTVKPDVLPPTKDFSADTARLVALTKTKERSYHQGAIPGLDAPSAPSAPVAVAPAKKEVKTPVAIPPKKKKKVVIDLASSWGS
jgi:hypothetical protein